MAELLGQRQIDLALLPINGRDPGRGVAGNLTGVEAVELARDIRASLVIPCHYEMFAFNTASPDLFIRTANELRQPYRVLKCGERFTLEAQQG
jgi:L-ascorbate metabolism protein UlaG (beta-lactamase superfamily)